MRGGGLPPGGGMGEELQDGEEPRAFKRVCIESRLVGTGNNYKKRKKQVIVCLFPCRALDDSLFRGLMVQAVIKRLCS